MERVKVLVERIRGTEDLPLPRYMTEHASGMDIYAAVEKEVELKPGERSLIPTGIRLALPEGHEAQIRPRSGLALKYGVSILNTPGTIDCDYRGEVGVILINLGDKAFRVKRGDRIGQLVVQKTERAHLELTEKLPSSDRSSGGFGHTGP
jgi:dUTP pyrophosphatase